MPERRRVCKVSDEELLRAAVDVPNMRQLLRRLGIAAYGGNYESVRRRLERLGALTPHLKAGSGPTWDLTELAEAVAASESAAGTLRVLGLVQSGWAQGRLMQQIADLGLSTAHWTRQASTRGRRPARRVPLDQLLVKGRLIGTDKLRRRLLDDGVLPHRCACCALSEWRGRPIPLELDHINGDRTDNRLENLRLLCPNCHAQTDTYRGRNIGRPVGVGRPLMDPEELFSGTARLALIMRRTG